MAEQRCRNCRHWGGGFILPGDDYRWLDNDLNGMYRVCVKTVTHGYLDDNEPTDTSGMLAYAEDYDGQPRGLWTAPGFGCVQWEPKE